MAERSTISQVVQLGVEATPGTDVAASKRLQSLSFEMTPNPEVAQFRPSGSKYRTLTVMGREWTTGSLSGLPTYDEIIYPLASVLTTPTVTPGTGTDVYEWEFAPKTYDEDTPKTFTIEHGSSLRAERFSHVLLTDMGLSISRTEVSLSGSLLAQEFQDNITLTEDPTVLPLVPLVPGTFDVFMDSAYASVGTTKVGRLLSMNWGIGSRFGPLWVIDSEDSFVATVELEPSLEIGFTMAANAEGMALLQAMRDGDQKVVRIRAQGPEIATGEPHEFQLDLGLALAGMATGDTEGVRTVQWTGVGVHNNDMDGAIKCFVRNTRPSM